MDFSRTFFVTTTTYKRYPYFADLTKARRFFRVLYHYRGEGKYLVHAFVLMPDHLHLILTPSPTLSLERAVQFIKGGSSFQMRLPAKLWQPSFTNHRVRDYADYGSHLGYIERNPVKSRLAEAGAKHPLCSAYPGWKLDVVPTGAEAPCFSGFARRGLNRALPQRVHVLRVPFKCSHSQIRKAFAPPWKSGASGPRSEPVNI